MFFLGEPIYAASSAEGALGVCNIEAPKYNASGSKYHYVYFGTAPNKTYKNGSNSNSYLAEGGDSGPIRFRVLDTKSNDATPKKALFMLTEYAIGYKRWNSSGQDWDSSEMKAWLNGNSAGNVYYDCFTAEEKGILEETVTNRDTTGQNWCGTSQYARKNSSSASNQSNNLLSGKGNRIFLLSTWEVTQNEYGFENDNIYDSSDNHKNRKCYLANSSTKSTSGNGSVWWLRSAYSYVSYTVADMTATGAPGASSSESTAVVVRFALNVPLMHVIYASDVSVTESQSSTFKAISSMTQTVPPSAGVGHQLTIKSGNAGTSFKITESSITKKVGETISLTYSGCTTGAGQNICAIMKNSNAAGPHYFVMPVKNVSLGSGTLNLTLPSDDTAVGSYTMLVYNEKDNGAKKTNIAKYDTVALTVKPNDPPTIGTVYKNSTNTGFRVTATDDIGLSKIADSSNGNTTYASISKTSATTNFTTASAISSFRVYDNGNKYATYTVSNATLDNEDPTGSVTYSNGVCTITAQDTGSGLWKIVYNGNEIKNCTGSYPTTSQTVTISGPISEDSATIHDAVNNTYSVSLDNKAPTLDLIEYDQGIYTIKVTDTVSGLWKITDNSGNILPNGDYSSSYPKTQQTYVSTGPVTVSQIRLYDAAGNNIPVDLDNTEPTVSRAYKKGTDAIIEASDTGSGLWKITEDIGGEAKVTLSGSSQLVKFKLSNDSITTVYVYDHAGKYKEVTLIDDTAKPTYEIPTYNQGTYTIKVTDEESGLWKITDDSGNILPNGDYSSSYPRTQQTYEGTGPIEKIRIYDALETYETVTLDATIPTASGYYNGSKIKVTAQDEESGLWKIAESEGESAISSSSFTGTSQKTEIIDSGVSTVYVYDHAGNCKELDLTQDVEAPTYTTTYSQGTTTITVSDSGSGVASIGSTTYGDYPASQSYTVPLETTSVTLKDALENPSTATVDRTEPEVTRAYRKGTMVVIETSKAGVPQGTEVAELWKITESTESGADIKANLSGLSQVVQFTVSSGTKTVYVYDHAGNYNTVDLTTEYKTEPEASVSYADGTYTITARAQNTGLWKITDVSGTILSSTDYSVKPEYTDYPTTQQTYKAKGPISLEKVYIYDAVGNVKELALDNVAPTMHRAYKNDGTNAMVEVSDSGSGLWKITESTEENAETSKELSGETEKATFTLSSNDVQKVYVYDKGGNYTEVNLNVDGEAPSYEGPTYGGGIITLIVTDNKSGISSIENRSYSDYPQSAQTYTVNTGTPTVRLTDAVGNYVDVEIDITKPSVTNVYRNEAGTSFKLTMVDSGTGLDRITNEAGTKELKNIQSIGKKAGTINFETTDPITAFNVYDNAGNVNEVKKEDMMIDKTEPSIVSITYSKGDCILTVKDNESGMWKIVDGTNNTILKDYSVSE